MLFNSINYFIFLTIFFLIYWLLLNKKIKSQNLFIVISSYIFYSFWNWKFLSIIIFSTLIDYTSGLLIYREKRKLNKQLLLGLSILVNIGILVTFKYYNFFIDNFILISSFFGLKTNLKSLEIILPVGISFYTFQTLSYSVDIYKNKLVPTKDLIAFSAFVSFFPQLVAGPIERATNFLTQFYRKRDFNYLQVVDGLRQILWGLFKKIVIADNCSLFVDLIFNNSAQYSGSTLLLGSLFFSFQIYCDFSGYSDIAIGTSRILGFNMQQNFNYPYFSKNILEFWNRWHISLTSWFRDYIYIPLGGNKSGLLIKIRNILYVFILSGLWHGANWTFVFWGFLNSFYYVLYLFLISKLKVTFNKIQNNFLLKVKEALSISFTFTIISFTWIFFRSDSLTHAIQFISGILSFSLFTVPVFDGFNKSLLILLFIIIFTIIEWNGKKYKYAIEKTGEKWPRLFRWSFYSMLIYIIGMFTPSNELPFIYFQF